MKKSTEPQKSATLTLRANDSTLTLTALRRPDGTARSFATTKDSTKRVERGASASHADMQAAIAHLAVLAKSAEKQGWQRGVRIHASKPDAWTKIPAPPAAKAA